MINELINSINEMLVEKFPNTKIYTSKLEKEIVRPSFFIRYVTSRQADLNRNSLYEYHNYEDYLLWSAR